MTVSVNSAAQFTVGTLIKRAYQLCGLVDPEGEPSTAQYAMARDFLEIEVDSLSAEGIDVRAWTFEYITCVADTASYSLDNSTLDVADVAAYIPASNSNHLLPDTERPMTELTIREWQVVQPKTSEGDPTQFWVNKEALPMVIHPWPIPQEAGHIRLLSQRSLADVDANSVTFDLREYWAKALLFGLAVYLSPSASLPLQQMGAFEKKYMDAKMKAKLKAINTKPGHMARSSGRDGLMRRRVS